jgi:uncharacterized membrane protein
MSRHVDTRAGTEAAVVQPVPDVEPGVARGAAEADRRATQRVLGVFIVALGLAHLTKRRLFPTLVPDWLAPVRREVDVTTGGLQVLAGFVMFVPSLRRFARWANLALLLPAVPAAIDEMRRPERRRHRDRPRMTGVAPVVAAGRAPAQVCLAGVLWWATKRR